MAKKATKKEAPAAKKKAAAKPTKTAAVKTAPAKGKKPVKAAPAKKVTSETTKPASKAPAKKAPEKIVEKPVVQKLEKVAKEAPEKAPAATKKSKATDSAAPKREKKTRLDKTGLNEDQVKWHELHEKYKAAKAPMYAISAQFEAKSPVQHKIFGWGYILSNEYDRLEVLFEDGKRMLISNRKMS